MQVKNKCLKVKSKIMKQTLILTCFLLISTFSQSVFAQEDPFITDYVERLENSRKYVLVVAEMMPEEKYEFRATAESFSFAQNLLHIGYAADWHSQSLLGGRESRVWSTDTVFKVADKSKEEMIALIDSTFDETITLIENFDTAHLDDQLDYFGLNRTKRQILLLLADHITHHRAQMLVSMRLNGLTPPRYVLYQ